MTRSELTAVARLARRTARRNWQRTVLVMLLVAVPVAVAMFVAAVQRASDLTPEDHAAAELGQAELAVRAWSATPAVVGEVEDLLAEFASGAEVDVVRSQYRSRFTITDLDPAARLAAGKVTVVAGRVPDGAGEVALSQRELQKAGRDVGDEITLPIPTRADPTTYTIVGTVVDPVALSRPLMLVTEGEFDRIAGTTPGGAPREVETEAQWLLADVTDPAGLTTEIAQRQESAGEPGHGVPAEAFPVEIVQRSRFAQGFGGAADDAMTPGVVGTLTAGALLAEVALIAGAAYATGARRRLRELGLLSSNGATVAHLRAAVVGEAAVAGVLGALLGLALGIAAVTLGQPLVQRFVDRFVEGRVFRLSDAIGPMVVGMLAVVLAAWLPARTAARVPTVTALAGRMPLSRPPRWIVPGGLGLAAFGGLLLLVSLTASGSGATTLATFGVVMAIGAVGLLAVPLVASLGRYADRLPASLRLVVRDATRQRTRAAAAVAAAMVLLLAPVVLGASTLWDARAERARGLPDPGNQVVVTTTADTPYRSTDHPPTDAEVAEVRDVLAGADEAEIEYLAPPELSLVPLEPRADLAPAGSVAEYDASLIAAVATEALVAAIGDPRVDAAITAGDPVLLGVEERDRVLDLGGETVTAREVGVPVLRGGMPRLLVPAERADRLGLERQGRALLFVTEDPVTGDQREALYDTMVPVSVPWTYTDPATFRLAAVGVALAVVLLVLGLVVALSATESDHDLRTMVAVGAPPRMRRRFLGLQTAYYAVLGGVLAVPLGLALFKIGMSSNASVYRGPFGTHVGSDIDIPWDVLGMVLVGIPLIAGGMIALLVRSATTVPPRRLG